MKPTQLKTKIPADFSVHIDGFPKNFDIDIYLAKLLILINHKPSLETHELAKKIGSIGIIVCWIQKNRQTKGQKR